MLIICPNCATSYQVENATLGAAGRSVRCMHCRSIWFATPSAEAGPGAARAPSADNEAIAAFSAELGQNPPDQPPGTDEDRPGAAEELGTAEMGTSDGTEPVAPSLDDLMDTKADPDGDATALVPDDSPEPPAEPDPAAYPDVDAPGLVPMASDEVRRPTRATTIEDGGEDGEAFIARRAKRQAARKKRQSPLKSVPALIVALVAVIGALMIWRSTIVRHAPQMASLYGAIGFPVNLRGLAFAEVQVAKDTHDGVSVLVVEGTIVSSASAPVEVPRLRLAMRNDKGSEIYAWTAMPTGSVLAPGETMTFRSRLASPPSDGRAVAVRFFNRRDAAAGLQ